MVLILTLGFFAPMGCLPCADTPRTIVLLTIDTLRRDAVGCYGATDRPSLTPALDAFARTAVRFEDARSPVPLTLPAHATMLSGLPPAVTQVRVNAATRVADRGARRFPLLAEALRARGWRTGAFVSAEPLHRTRGLDQGFEVYDDGADAGHPGPTSLERAGPVTVARALAYLGALPGDARAFVWVHLYEPHGPYLRYEDDVRAADAAAGVFLRGVEQLRLGPSAVLVTSDHGEMLGELGEETHGLLLGDGVLRVPFLLKRADGRPGVRADPVDLADVAPTLAGLARVPWASALDRFGGLDVSASEAPAGRVRAAESLYAHHRFRWAQLAAVTGPEGTLVELGAGRTVWLAAARVGGTTAPTAALAEALAAYKSSEDHGAAARVEHASPYGGSGPVEPFLTTEVNGRLPDPYERIGRVQHFMQTGARLASLRRRPDPSIRDWVPRVTAMQDADPDNPEVCSLLGFAEEALAIFLEESAQDGHAARARAEDAFGRAFALGQRDSATLSKWTAVNGAADPEAALRRLDMMGREAGVVWGLELWMLRAELLARLPQRAAEREHACREAYAAARTPADVAMLARVCP